MISCKDDGQSQGDPCLLAGTRDRFVTFCNQKVTKEFWGCFKCYHVD
jgi:hypothetical protein